MKTFLVGLLLAATATRVAAAEYVYSDFAVPMADSHGAFAYRVDTTEKLERHGHTGSRLYVCGDGDEFHCFIAGGFSFAVPRSGLPKVGDHWKCKRSEYFVDAVESLQILGLTQEVMIISSPYNAERRDIFYYSPTAGLLAMKFEHKGHDAAQIFFLRGSKGFPY